MRVPKLLAISFLCVFASLSRLEGQTTSAELRGTVVDQQGGIVTGAVVKLQNEGTNDTRTANTNEAGLFVFTAVVPGTYRISIESPGFNAMEQTGIVIRANERRGLGNLELKIGGLVENVSVEASNVIVRTTSSENSAALNAQQLGDLVTRGRDVVNLLRVLPGVSATAEANSVGGNFGTATPNISGVRNDMNTVALDGQVGQDNDLQAFFQSSTALDAIEEVVVLRNNYQAEYGRNGGAVVNVISKSGTRDFRGSAYGYLRDESLNSNEFFNIRNSLPKPLYSYKTLGATLGGPIFIPGKFNTDRSKLFFFYSREDWRIQQPANIQQVTMPTALERAGDFSQTLDTNGTMIVIRDPLTGQPFPGNVIPPNRINPLGQAILNIFPLPNFFDRSISRGNYNYQFQDITEQPKTQNLLRIDYRPTSSDHISVRPRNWTADQQAFNPVAGSQANWNWFRFHYLFTEKSLQAAYTKVVSSNIVNELNGSYRRLGEESPYDSASIFDPGNRTRLGLSGLGQFNPAGNPLNLLPALSFNGVPQAPTIAYDGRLPIDAWDTRLILLDNVSMSRGNHTFKAGVYFERNVGTEGPRSNFGGNFSFNRDPNNSLDANYPYATALLGNFTTYSEANARTSALNKRVLVEWFGQDSWRANRKMTLELGLRTSWASPLKFPNGDAAGFVPERYDPSKAPQLIRPARNASGQVVGQNPITGEFVPGILIGSFAPGSGDPFNGMVTPKTAGFEDGFQSSGGVQLAPRAGFAYDVTGDGNTAIRGNFGITRNMAPSNGNVGNGANPNPPNQVQPQIVYGNVSTYLGTSGVLSPFAQVTGWVFDYKVPTLYSWSAGVQRNIGGGIAVEATYVGNKGRNLAQTRDINLVPPGSRFLPQNANPTNPAVPLPDNFFRPYPGYGTIVMWEYNGTSQYNALQTSLNRNLRGGLAFGVSYTLSKSTDLAAANVRLPTYQPDDVYMGGYSAFDQTHVFTASYTWMLPSLGNKLQNGVVKAVFDNWSLSGIATLASGTPITLAAFTTVNGVDPTNANGGGDPQRLNLKGPLNLPRGERTFDRWFAVENVALAPRGEIGNAGKTPLRGPGTHNYDLSVVKNVPFGASARRVEVRWEIYNLFNSFQYANVNTAARFDAAGNQINTAFGQVSAGRPPRIMQASLRVVF